MHTVTTRPSWLVWVVPALLVALLAPFSGTLDLAIARYFYVDGNFSTYVLFAWFYNYGPLFAQITGVAAALYLLFTWFTNKAAQKGAAAWVLLVTLILGPGLLTNVLLKDHWGRPRPKETQEFGGVHDFRAFYRPSFHWNNKGKRSFPSGHASTGFYWFVLVVIGWYERNRLLILIGWVASVSLGTLLSLTRMAQGGHFFSDIIAAAALIWWTAWAVGAFFYSRKNT